QATFEPQRLLNRSKRTSRGNDNWASVKTFVFAPARCSRSANQQLERSVNAFNQWNQASGCDGIHFALAPWHPDSDFASDFSAARLHVNIFWVRAHSTENSSTSNEMALCRAARQNVRD